jgi:hypothetical protein
VAAGPACLGGAHTISTPLLLCGKQVWCLRHQGRDRATCGRKEANATCRARGWWCGPRSGAGVRKHRRSHCRPKSDPLTRAAWDLAPPARPRPRGRRGRSSSCGAEESLPRPASAGRERVGSWGGVAATAPASGRASTAGGRLPSRGREVGEGSGWTEELTTLF